MNPFDTQFLAQERIDDLMRVSSDLHRGAEGGGFASRIAAALAVPAAGRPAGNPMPRCPPYRSRHAGSPSAPDPGPRLNRGKRGRSRTDRLV